MTLKKEVAIIKNKQDSTILLAHGDGGLLTRELIDNIFVKYFDNPFLKELSDSAILPAGKGQIALTTDSFVVNPVFFPGGDIGKLAVCGTVNDLAVSGSQPLYITAAFIIEEGFPVSYLEKIVISMSAACKEAGVSIVAGDTKIVPRGQAGEIFITTSGVGFISQEINQISNRIHPGDKLIINGTLGNHGLTILSAREDLGLESSLASDCAPLNNIIKKLCKKCTGIKFMRDLTRGGFATAAKEIAKDFEKDLYIWESKLPIDPGVQGAAEILGLDPLYLANEGKFLAIVSPDHVDQALSILRHDKYGQNAELVGEVREGTGNVYLKTLLGGTRSLDLMAGSPLPRIC